MSAAPVVSFFAPGKPAQQGNHSISRAGRIYETSHNHRPWRDTLIWYARQAMFGLQTIDAPVKVAATFWFPRPQSHYGTGANCTRIKPGSPRYKTSAPDLDKLQRALGDALEQAGVLRNDSRIAVWETRKRYVRDTQREPGVAVDVWRLP